MRRWTVVETERAQARNRVCISETQLMTGPPCFSNKTFVGDCLCKLGKLDYISAFRSSNQSPIHGRKVQNKQYCFPAYRCTDTCRVSLIFQLITWTNPYHRRHSFRVSILAGWFKCLTDCYHVAWPGSDTIFFQLFSFQYLFCSIWMRPLSLQPKGCIPWSEMTFIIFHLFFSPILLIVLSDG